MPSEPPNPLGWAKSTNTFVKPALNGALLHWILRYSTPAQSISPILNHLSVWADILHKSSNNPIKVENEQTIDLEMGETIVLPVRIIFFSNKFKENTYLLNIWMAQKNTKIKSQKNILKNCSWSIWAALYFYFNRGYS